MRTQIYLPEEIHSNLQKLAKQKGTTLSKLIRQGAETVLKKGYGKKTPQQKALEFFAKVPKEYRINKTGKELIDLLRKERDDE